MTQTFFIPGPLPGANDIIRKHWRVYDNLKREWGGICAVYIRKAKLTPVRTARIAFEWHEPIPLRKQKRDPDNIIFGEKFALDALVQTGILPVISTAIAHKEAGIGMIGAGITHPPAECFEKALLAFAASIDPGSR